MKVADKSGLYDRQVGEHVGRDGDRVSLGSDFAQIDQALITLQSGRDGSSNSWREPREVRLALE